MTLLIVFLSFYGQPQGATESLPKQKRKIIFNDCLLISMKASSKTAGS